jgi:hypothetical protein
MWNISGNILWKTVRATKQCYVSNNPLNKVLKNNIKKQVLVFPALRANCLIVFFSPLFLYFIRVYVYVIHALHIIYGGLEFVVSM